jgi:mRNA interferase HicA
VHRPAARRCQPKVTQKRVNSRGARLKQSEFKRWLLARGVTMRDGAKHLKLYFNGRQAVMSRQPAREMGEGLRKAILKQLGLD